MSQTFDSPPADQDNFGNWEVEQELPKSGGGGCLKGCLIVTAILLVLTALSVWYVSSNWRGLAGSLGKAVVAQMLEDSGIPEQERAEIMEQVDRVVVPFEEGRLTEAQVEKLIEEVMASPLSAPVIAFIVEKKYFDSSGLIDEEKQNGRMTLRRCVRGLFDGLLTEDDLDEILSHIGTKDSEGNWEFRDDVSDEELRKFLADAKERADDAGVAETVEEVDPSDEIKRIVDSVLNPEAPEAEDPAMPEPQGLDMREETDLELESAESMASPNEENRE